MNTSSSVGRETLTDRIGTPSSANSRGTNSSPPGTPNVTAPSATRASMPKALGSAAIAASSSSVWIVTRSVPTCAFSASGASRATICAVVHDRDPVAPLGLVHVVGGHEDRDLLALLELADVGPDRAPGLGVEADRRLVEEQHARGVHQAPRDLEAAAHPAGEGAHDVVRALPQADHRQHLLHARLDQIALDAVELGVQAEVLRGGQVAVERRVLEHEADVAADVVALGTTS